MQSDASPAGWTVRGLVLAVAGGLVAALFIAFFSVTWHPPVEDNLPADGAIGSAQLESAAGTVQVGLPHKLKPSDFQPQGSTVRYRLSVFLTEQPPRDLEDPLAVLVTKMALSGSLSVNGVLVGNCGADRLENLRCLHQPQLFVPPPGLWQKGLNQVDFTIYATDRQANGLSRVRVARLSSLQSLYHRHQWVSTVLPEALTWMSVALGLLALALSAVLKRQSVYFWFALTTLVNAVVTINSYVEAPGIPIEFFNWLIFFARMMSVPFFILTALAIFNRSRRWINRLCVGFAVLGPLAVWLSDNNRALALILYVPWLFVVVLLAVASIFWAVRSRRTAEILFSLTLVVLAGCSLMDWLKTSGFANFEVVYLLPYAFGVALVLMGGSLVLLMATAYGASLSRTSELEDELSHRIAYDVTRNIPIGTFSLLLPVGAHEPYFFFVSARFKELTGRRFAAGEGVEYLAAAVHPQDRAHWIQQIDRAIADRAPFAMTARVVVDAGIRWVSIEAVPSHRVDGSTLWAGIVVDETEKVVARNAAEQNRAAFQESMIVQSRMREREQLLRDMHDGFGSQLAGLKMQARRGDLTPAEMSALLEDISADLHLVVDTMGHTSLTLNDALADMRYRVGARLGSAASRLRWQVDLDGKPPLEPRIVLHILRIVQEALHNAMRHADAELIEIGAHFDGTQKILKVWVRDRGPGLSESYRPGRGLNNMRERAREIGAELRIDNWRAERNEELANSEEGPDKKNYAGERQSQLSGTEVVMELALKNVIHLD